MATKSEDVSGSNMKYSIDGKGLVVIARQIHHNVFYRRQRAWTNSILNYGADVKRILKLFPAKKKTKGITKIVEYIAEMIDGKKPKADVITGTDLINGTSEDSFFAFMEKVKEHKVHKPSFLMFFLMSHGFENGEFLLAANGTKVNEKMEPEGPCCGAKTAKDNHDLKGKCYGRHIVKDVIEEVGKTYTDIPKIFILQCCRGGNCCVVSEGCADDPPRRESGEADAELFIPESQDTLVLRSCVEGSTCWVPWEGIPSDDDHNQGGSLLIQSFCRCLEELGRANQEYGKLKKRLRGTQMSDLAEYMQDRREDLIGGWMMNVCQRTTALVTNLMYIELCLLPTPFGQLLKLPQNANADDNTTFTEFTEKLERHKADSKHGEEIQQLLRICNSKHQKKRKGKKSKKKKRSPRAVAMLEYLRKNVRLRSPYYPLAYLTGISNKKRKKVTTILDSLIAEMRDKAEQIPLDKQQPHISSSLSKKLFCLDLM